MVLYDSLQTRLSLQVNGKHDQVNSEEQQSETNYEQLANHECRVYMVMEISSFEKSKIVFSEKSLSVHMFVRPVDPSNPVCHHKKVTETQNFAKTKLSDLLHG